LRESKSERCLVMMWPTFASGAQPSSSEAASMALRSWFTNAVSALSCAAEVAGFGFSAASPGTVGLPG